MDGACDCLQRINVSTFNYDDSIINHSNEPSERNVAVAAVWKYLQVQALLSRVLFAFRFRYFCDILFFFFYVDLDVRQL
jgi:hypothetical protein